MYRNAVGFNPQTSMLKGLRGTPNYGKAMAAAAQQNFQKSHDNAEFMAKQSQQERDLGNKAASTKASAKQGQMQNQQRLQNQQKQVGQQHSSYNSTMTGIKRGEHVAKQNTILNALTSD